MVPASLPPPRPPPPRGVTSAALALRATSVRRFLRLLCENNRRIDPICFTRPNEIWSSKTETRRKSDLLNTRFPFAWRWPGRRYELRLTWTWRWWLWRGKVGTCTERHAVLRVPIGHVIVPGGLCVDTLVSIDILLLQLFRDLCVL